MNKSDDDWLDVNSPSWNQGHQEAWDGKQAATTKDRNYLDGWLTGEEERYFTWEEGYEDGKAGDPVASEHPIYIKGHEAGVAGDEKGYIRLNDLLGVETENPQP